MTYTAYEAEIQSGAPVLLFLFTKGATEWRMTTNAVDVVMDGETWTATQVKPSKFSLTQDPVKDALELQFPQDNAFAAQYLTDGSDDDTSVVVYRAHLVDPAEDMPIVWQGTVSSAYLTDRMIAVSCESLLKRLSRSNLMATYQANCRHAVYSTACGLVRGNFDYTATVDSIAANVVTLTAGHGITSGALTGGEIEKGGYRRFIVLHEGDDLTLIRPLFGLAASDSVTLIEGCDRSLATCIAKTNVANYGGFPWIPQVNPFESGVG